MTTPEEVWHCIGWVAGMAVVMLLVLALGVALDSCGTPVITLGPAEAQ